MPCANMRDEAQQQSAFTLPASLTVPGFKLSICFAGRRGLWSFLQHDWQLIKMIWPLPQCYTHPPTRICDMTTDGAISSLRLICRSINSVFRRVNVGGLGGRSQTSARNRHTNRDTVAPQRSL